jgi:hypothetical protein
MAALSDYLESGILKQVFLSGVFVKPTDISIALTSDVAQGNQDGGSIPELPSGTAANPTGYARVSLGDPNDGTYWDNVGVDDSSRFKVYQVTSHDADGSSPEQGSGYFYPLYINSGVAASISDNSETTPRTFADFPGITLYSPNTGDNAYQSGVAVDPGSSYVLYDGNGFIKNKKEITFNTALTDWGYISGVAILDHSTQGSGNLLMFSQLTNPRQIFIGDNIKFDINSLEISVK